MAPVKPEKLSEKLKFSFSTLMMHLVKLKKMGYVYSPEKGFYSITRKGRRALSFPSLTPHFAKKLLSPVQNEKAFYFFAGIGNYLGVYANSLEDFCEKIRTIDVKAMEFHVKRDDFAN